MKNKNGISISIVNYNTSDRTIKCIQSILDDQPDCDFEILVHNNGSNLLEEKRWNSLVHINNSDSNLGFGQGHNANLLRAQYDVFLILNPDVTLNSHVLAALKLALDTTDVVAASPILQFPDGSDQISFRRFPSLRTECARIIGFDRLLDSRCSTLLRIEANQGIVEVEQPAGAVLAVTTDIMRDIGGFDARFPMYFEDVDLCRRLRFVGKIIALTNHTVIHDGEGTAKVYRTATTFWIEYSRRLYHLKFSEGYQRSLLLTACFLSCLTHFMAAIVKAIVGSKTRRAESRAKSYGYAMAMVACSSGSDKYWRGRFLKK